MLNLDTRIPLMAQERDYGRGFDMMQKAQENQLRLQALRDEYNAAKEERDRQKAIRQGVASELQKMQQGTPAQYRTTFPQTMPTGQMPGGMTGVLASERGQNLPQPALFGENILQGNFDINRELVSPAIAPKQPDIKDILTAQINAAVANNDVATAFDAKKKLRELEKNPIKWGMKPQKGINPATGLPDTFVTNESGELKFLNVSPYEEPKEQKATPVMVNGVPKTVKVPSTNEVKILMSDGTLMSGGSIQNNNAKNEMTGYQKIKLESELRDDYRTDSKTYLELKRQSDIIKNSLDDPSAAATLASATAFMKMLDPGSVVRESELAMAMKTNGALDRLGNYINVIQLGQVLTDQQKTDFKRLVDSYSKAAEEAHKNTNKKYKQIAIDYGLEPSRVVLYDVTENEKETDYMEYKKERDNAYKKGHYDLVRQLDEQARLDKLIK